MTLRCRGVPYHVDSRIVEFLGVGLARIGEEDRQAGSRPSSDGSISGPLDQTLSGHGMTEIARPGFGWLGGG
jgi:hypothetical protein